MVQTFRFTTASGGVSEIVLKHVCWVYFGKRKTWVWLTGVRAPFKFSGGARDTFEVIWTQYVNRIERGVK